MLQAVPLASREKLKEQVVDSVPKRIKQLDFGVLSKTDIVRHGVLEVCDRALFDLEKNRAFRTNGPLDGRMGVASKSTNLCETCGQKLEDCIGHFGYVPLELPAFHIGYFKTILTILQAVCKECSAILLLEKERRQYLRSVRRQNLDSLQKAQICKKIIDQCKKTKLCPNCGEINGTVKKAGKNGLKIFHDKFRAFNSSTSAKKIAPAAKLAFDESFEGAKEINADLEKHVKKAMDDMNPLRVLKLFRRISAPDCELLGMNPEQGRPEMFIWQVVPAPPVCIRPSLAQDMASTEDDITTKLSDIIHCNQVIKAGLLKGASIPNLMEQWDHLQLQVALYINSDMPGLDAQMAKTMRGFCQRLKGKQGRFRGNLSGKRVDFSARTVISPDPNLAIDEVAVPDRIAKNMTYPERVNLSNLERMRNTVKNGPSKHPGANAVLKKSTGLKIILKYGNLENHAKRLQIGDVVERHLIDGDIVLFNRQPSLHKLSILSHRVRIRPHRTFRLNECVCNPYNADFDGDEMNLHVPQTEEARAEATELMGVRHNLATPKNGEPIISAIQDFITAAYLLSSKDVFYSRKEFAHICMFMMHAEEEIDLPPPSIVKPQALWTGKQIFNVMMRPRKSSPVLINLDAPCKTYRKPDPTRGEHPSPDMSSNDAWLCIRNSEIMCGLMDKSTVGSGKKSSVFYIIMRDYGPDEAVMAMGRLAKLCARWLTQQGFSIGISDVTPPAALKVEKEKLIEAAYAECDGFIMAFALGELELQAGMDREATLESKISTVLSKVRTDAGDKCVIELSRRNAPLVMANSGSKGSNINVSQMVAVVGQQIIGGSRVQQGFQDRTLPHFPKHDRHPPSKGFVRNSFYTGLTPYEFIFHAMSGREGLVDTAVKTAETGYMSRRLMKSLEDLSTQYDDTVRNSASNIIQFQYGDDKLDPVNMEGKAQPVNFERTFVHSQSIQWNEGSEALPPWEVIQYAKQKLAGRKNKLERRALNGNVLDYDDVKPANTEAAENHAEKKQRAKTAKKQAQGTVDVDMKDQGVKASEDQANSDTNRKAEDREKLMDKVDYASFLPPVTTDALEAERDFLDSIEKFIEDKASAQGALRQRLGLSAATEKHESIQRNAKKSATTANIAVDSVSKLSQPVLDKFIDIALEKHHRSKVEPGHAVGAVGAQSIGEPGTQMTLKTFHFAGVAGMSITGGVPRIKEIINASKSISTPVIDVVLENKRDPALARRVKGRIEKTYLTDLLKSCQLQWYDKSCYIVLSLDFDTISKLGLDEDISMDRIKQAIVTNKKFKLQREYVSLYENILTIVIEPPRQDVKPTSKAAKAAIPLLLSERVEQVYRALPTIAVVGHPDATRAIIINNSKDKAVKDHAIAVEGYGLQACMNTPGVNGYKTKTNSIMEVREILGIEAARSTIVVEITKVMKDMDIDPRHMQLLADVMTSKGEILGITRFGLAKMRDSVLQLASFEKTPDHLFEAACKMKSDRIEGVSECIIMGQPMSVGTGAFKVIRPMGFKDEQLRRKKRPFEEAWRTIYAKAQKSI